MGCHLMSRAPSPVSRRVTTVLRSTQRRWLLWSILGWRISDKASKFSSSNCCGLWQPPAWVFKTVSVPVRIYNSRIIDGKYENHCHPEFTKVFHKAANTAIPWPMFYGNSSYSNGIYPDGSDIFGKICCRWIGIRQIFGQDYKYFGSSYLKSIDR